MNGTDMNKAVNEVAPRKKALLSVPIEAFVPHEWSSVYTEDEQICHYRYLAEIASYSS